MRLNNMGPGNGAKQDAKRRGRGIGSGLGKTSGRGHKGQSARAGGFHRIGFEGGQMPIQRRLPKRGFKSAMRGDTASVRLGSLAKIKAEAVDLQALKAANLVPREALRARVYLSGTLTQAVTLRGVAVTKGAAEAITKAGGRIEA